MYTDNTDNLPDRIIVSTPFKNSPIKSYGIVAICRETKTWLMVKQKYTYTYQQLASGKYRKSMLKIILSNITYQEFQNIKNHVFDLFTDLSIERIKKYLSE